MTFTAAKSHVANRGTPPDEFLATLVAWGKKQDDSLFEANAAHDIYSLIAPELATLEGTDSNGKNLFKWEGIIQRRAAMLEAMRVHAGFESSWNWNEGVDATNKTSLTHIEGQETGVFQVSFDSTRLDGSLRAYASSVGISTPQAFIPAMKLDHPLALTYYARLVRINIGWAGPLISKAILPWLNRDAVAEFQESLIA